jgi:hypothetical protein
MTKQEAANGFIVLSVIMHKRTLSWLVASDKNRETKNSNLNEIYVIVRQEKMG